MAPPPYLIEEPAGQARVQDCADLINIVLTGPHTTFLAPWGPSAGSKIHRRAV
nr:hypothetical protein GCM10010200_063760 [Actinomadura rugatobispora]